MTNPEDVNGGAAPYLRMVLARTPAQDTRGLVCFRPDGAGASCLRQQGVETPYTGYLRAAQKAPDPA